MTQHESGRNKYQTKLNICKMCVCALSVLLSLVSVLSSSCLMAIVIVIFVNGCQDKNEKGIY